METVEKVLSIFFTALIIIYSSWILLFFHSRRRDINLKTMPAISIIIPAHNEERYIENTVKCVLDATYPAEREVLIINDGSKDKTREIAIRLSQKDPRIKVIDTNHCGKSNAINKGVSEAKNEIVVVLDADSLIEKNALEEIVKPLGKEKTAAVSGVIRAVVTKNPLTWFQDFEYVIGSAWRHVYNNINSTYVLPVFVALKKKPLLEIGGFGSDMLAEDVDLGLRLRKAGYEPTMSKATLHTKVPLNITSLAKQRIRWGRGAIQNLRKHRDMTLNLQYGAVGLYGLPLQIYWFIHGLVAIPTTIYQILDGYLRYFVAYNTFLSYNVLKYFFGWISAYGIIEYAYKTFTGQYQTTPFFILVFTTFALNLAYNLLAIAKFSKPHPRHLIVLFFFFPYSIFVLTLYLTAAFYELLSKEKNMARWEKNY
jgi:cellulose synthase/poly-beta-1,6-N-acetylglucosamine synthase-like glycosyltransferase